jgi:hypothetical protein
MSASYPVDLNKATNTASYSHLWCDKSAGLAILAVTNGVANDASTI